jgi:hypothetical protein
MCLLALALAALRPSSGRRPPIHAAAALDAIARGRCPVCSAHFKIPSSTLLPYPPSGHVCPPPLPSVTTKHSLPSRLPPRPPDRHVSLQSRLLALCRLLLAAPLPRHCTVVDNLSSRPSSRRKPWAPAPLPASLPGDPSLKKRPMLAGLVHTSARRHPSPVCANVRPSALSCT